MRERCEHYHIQEGDGEANIQASKKFDHNHETGRMRSVVYQSTFFVCVIENGVRIPVQQKSYPGKKLSQKYVCMYVCCYFGDKYVIIFLECGNDLRRLIEMSFRKEGERKACVLFKAPVRFPLFMFQEMRTF